MLRPRPVPPAHKNQLYVPVKSVGFLSHHQETTPAFFRHHEVAKKRLEPKPTAAGGGLYAPASPHDHPHHHPFLTSSSTDTMTSLIHVRGRASVSDVSLSVEETPRKTPRTADREEETPRTADRGEEEQQAGGGGTPFLTEDPASSRSCEHRSSLFSPSLECSKYTVIGEPRFRKKRVRRSEWTLPRVGGDKKQQQHGGGQLGTLDKAGHHHPKTNSIDLRSIYGSCSKLQQVPPPAAKREDTVILPPLAIGRRREEAEASVDAQSLAEKRLVMRDLRRQAAYRRLTRDQVPRPAAYKPYFRSRQRQQRFARSLFGPDDVWERHPVPVSCARCPSHQSSQATLHYCDVLGRRFCRFCCESTERAFARAYEGNRLLVPSPRRTPTLLMMMEKEPSFIGVRKVVITKTTPAGQGQGEGQGQGQGP